MRDLEMKNITLITLLTLVVFLMGCASFTSARFPEKQEEKNSPLSAGNVSLHLEKGITTKSEVLNAFGSPNIVTKNREADEVWNYNRMSYIQRAGADGATFFFWTAEWAGARGVVTATTKSIDLIITFDSNDVVKNYSMIQANF